MKKEHIRLIAHCAVLLALYCVVAFSIPFDKTAAYWISFVFTLIAFAVVGVAIYIAFIKHPDAKSRFYGFPVAKIGVIYGVAQLVVSLIIMALAQWMPWWIAVAVYAVGLGAAVIGLISAEVVVEEIQTQDVKLKKETDLMRSLQSKVSQMASQTDVVAIKTLADEIRYSDPVSSDAIADAEADLAAAIDDLQAAVVDGDDAVVAELCEKASDLLAERNRLCKLSKN